VASRPANSRKAFNDHSCWRSTDCSRIPVMSVLMVAVAWMASHGSGPAWSATQSSNLSAHQCCRRHLRIPSLAFWLGCATRGCAYPRNWVPYGRPRTVQHEIGTGSSHRRSAQSCVLVVPSGRVCSDSPLPRQSHPTNLVNPRPDKKNAHTAIPTTAAAKSGPGTIGPTLSPTCRCDHSIRDPASNVPSR